MYECFLKFFMYCHAHPCVCRYEHPCECAWEGQRTAFCPLWGCFFHVCVCACGGGLKLYQDSLSTLLIEAGLTVKPIAPSSPFCLVWLATLLWGPFFTAPQKSELWSGHTPTQHLCGTRGSNSTLTFVWLALWSLSLPRPSLYFSRQSLNMAILVKPVNWSRKNSSFVCCRQTDS